MELIKQLEDVYIRLSDGLILYPVRYTAHNGIKMINNSLFNHDSSDEPPITKYDLEPLGFVRLDTLVADGQRKSFMEELKEYNETGRTCFCCEGLRFCDC